MNRITKSVVGTAATLALALGGAVAVTPVPAAATPVPVTQSFQPDKKLNDKSGIYYSQNKSFTYSFVRNAEIGYTYAKARYAWRPANCYLFVRDLGSGKKKIYNDDARGEWESLTFSASVRKIGWIEC